MDYSLYTDEQLVKIIKAGDEEPLQTLIARYVGAIKAKSSALCPFADFDDMVQVGTIALYSAISVYDENLSNFSTFVNLCIARSLISAYRKLFNKKEVPEHIRVSLDNFENTTTVTPESLLIEKEECDALTKKIKAALSEFEYKVLCEYLNNSSYNVIAAKLSVDKKSVNNAMVRLRSKIKAIK